MLGVGTRTRELQAAADRTLRKKKTKIRRHKQQHASCVMIRGQLAANKTAKALQKMRQTLSVGLVVGEPRGGRGVCGVLGSVLYRTSKGWTRHTSHVICHTSHITHITLHTSHITHHSTLITHHTSHFTHHTSHITHHTSHITHHTSHRSTASTKTLRKA